MAAVTPGSALPGFQPSTFNQKPVTSNPVEMSLIEDRLVYSPLARIGGSVSAEHGIGLAKRAYLSISRTEQEIRTMRRLKLAFDPNGILNPNNVFPLEESS